MRKKFLLLLLFLKNFSAEKVCFCLLFFLTLFTALPLSGESKKVCSFRIIQTTDIHGQYSNFSAPGISSLAFVVKKAMEEKGKENTLYIDCGDILQGTYESAYDRGKMMIPYLNSTFCEVFVPGNHDLEFGTENFLKTFLNYRGKILSCNLRPHEKEGVPAIFSYAFFRKGGADIAVIGMSPRFLQSWFSPKDLQGIIQKNAARELNKLMPLIMKRKPHFIILAMHEGEYRNTLKEGKQEKGFLSRLFRQYPQIDLVLGGHTHMVSEGKKCYQNQWYVQAPPLAAGAAVVDVIIDAATGKKLSLRSEIRYSSREKTDPETGKLFAPVLQETEKAGKERLGYLPFAPRPVGKSLKKAAGNPFAVLMGKVLREAAGTPLAFHGTMGNYQCHAGFLTQRRLFLLLPYENRISTIPVTKEECRRILEEQIKNVRYGNFQQPSGVKYTYKNGKVTGLTAEANPVWDKESMPCAFTSYALSGAGGRFPVLASIASKKAHLRKDLSLTVREAAKEYIRKNMGKSSFRKNTSRQKKHNKNH